MPDGCESLGLGVLDPLYQRLPGIAEDVVVDPSLVARLAAHKLVRGHAEVLAHDIPHGDIECADRAYDRRAAEMAEAVHVLPVVLDSQWVLPNEVAAELLDGCFGGLQISPRPRFANPDDTFVGVDLGEQIAIDGDGFDLRDFHCSSYSYC